MRANYSRLPSVVLYACLPDRGVAQFTTRLAPGLKAISLTQAICLGQEVCGLSPFVGTQSCGFDVSPLATSPLRGPAGASVDPDAVSAAASASAILHCSLPSERSTLFSPPPPPATGIHATRAGFSIKIKIKTLAECLAAARSLWQDAWRRRAPSVRRWMHSLRSGSRSQVTGTEMPRPFLRRCRRQAFERATLTKHWTLTRCRK